MTPRVRPTIAVSLVYASTSVVWASYALLAVALPFRFQSLGLSVVQYGIAAAALALGMLVTESVWGVLSFRIANVRTVLVLGIAVALVYLAIGASNTFLMLVVSLGLLGALIIFQVPLMRWMALTALGPGTRGRGTGVYGLFSGAGLVVGTTLGPFLFVEYGFTVLTLAIVATYSAGVAMMVLLPWHQVTLPPRQPGFLRHLREVITRPFMLAAALVVLAFLSRALVWNFLQYYSVSLFHGTPPQAGYVIGAAQLTSLAAGAVLGTLVDRWGPARSAPFGFLLVTGGAFGTVVLVLVLGDGRRDDRPRGRAGMALCEPPSAGPGTRAVAVTGNRGRRLRVVRGLGALRGPDSAQRCVRGLRRLEHFPGRGRGRPRRRALLPSPTPHRPGATPRAQGRGTDQGVSVLWERGSNLLYGSLRARRSSMEVLARPLCRGAPMLQSRVREVSIGTGCVAAGLPRWAP